MADTLSWLAAQGFKKYLPFARSPRLGVIGTSLVQQNDRAEVSATIPKISYHSRGWLRWAHALSGGIFSCPVWYDPTVRLGWEPSQVSGDTRGFWGLNFGVSGQTIALIDARKAQTLALTCDVIVIDDGTNDAGQIPAADMQTAREALAQYYLDLGKIVILLPILARATSAWASGGAERQAANYCNRRTRTFCRSRQNCYFFDWNGAWVDFTNATDTVPKAANTVDGTHFSPIGAYRVGKAFAAFLATILPAPFPRVWGVDDRYSAANPLGNLFSNTFLLGTTGTVGTGVTNNGGSNGGVATGFTVQRYAGASAGNAYKEVRADGRGEFQCLAVTPSGGAVDVFYIRTNPSTTAHSFAAGTWVQASCIVELNAYAGWRGVTLTAVDQGANGMSAYGMEPYNTLSTNSLNWQGDEGFRALIETPPFQLVSGSAAIQDRLEVRIDTTQAGSPIVKTSEWLLHQVADPSLALAA